MNKLFLISGLLIFLFTGCEKENVEQKASLSTPVLTGFICRDEAATTYYAIGNPNLKLHEETGVNQITEYSMLSYPNPNVYDDGYHHLYKHPITIFFRSGAPATSAHFWIESGSYLGSDQNYSTYMGANYFLPSERIIDKEMNVVMGENNFYVDVAYIQPGYYRAYIEINGVLLWDNLIINKQVF